MHESRYDFCIYLLDFSHIRILSGEAKGLYINKQIPLSIKMHYLWGTTPKGGPGGLTLRALLVIPGGSTVSASALIGLSLPASATQ